MTTDLTTYEKYLIHWAKNVSGNKGFFVGEETPILQDYFLFQPLLLTRLSRTFNWYDRISGKYYKVYPATWRLRLTTYGDKCEEAMIKLENSLYSDEWNNYLKSKNLNFADCTNIRISNDFNITQFLKQAQCDIIFNLVISEEYVDNWIDIVSGDLTVKENNSITIIETINVDNS